MNFTGGVLLALLYVLPGIFFVFGLARLFNTKLPSPFDGQLSTGIVLALLAAILMHSIGLLGFSILAYVFEAPKPDVGQAFTLLLGDYKSQQAMSALSDAGKNWPYISAYFLCLSAAAYLTGRAVNSKLKINRPADWYKLLREEADMLWLTTDMEIGGVAYLFAGMLQDFKVSSEGHLERVVLLGAVRRTLKRPTESEMSCGDENYQDGGWVPIPGEHVVLSMSSSNTVNVDYWYLEESPAPEENGATAQE